MRTDPLIDRLTNDLRPVRRRTTLADAGILAGLGAVELGLFLAMGFSRSDMPMAMHLPSFWWKLTSLGLIALVSGTVAVVSFDPLRSPQRGLRWVIALIAVCLSIGWALDASRDGVAALVTRLDWRDGIQCFGRMVGLSLPAVVALGLLMHRGAPTDRHGTALAAGLTAAAWGAFVFVFDCPFDDPLYVAVWYSLSCSAVTLFARLTLPRLTRW
jgi:hypothetical protein